MVSAIVTYDWRIDLCVALALWAIARLAASGALLRVHTGLLVVALGLFTLALAAPSMLGGTAFVDWRFPIMAALSVVTAIRPVAPLQPGKGGSFQLSAFAQVARTAWIADVWQARQADVVAVEHALAPMPAGASVLPAGLWPSAPRRRHAAVIFSALLLTCIIPPAVHGECIRPTLFSARGSNRFVCWRCGIHFCAGRGTRTHFPPSVLRTFSVESVFLWLCHRLAKPLLLCTSL